MPKGRGFTAHLGKISRHYPDNDAKTHRFPRGSFLPYMLYWPSVGQPSDSIQDAPSFGHRRAR